MNRKGEINNAVFCEQYSQVEDIVECLTYYRYIVANPIEQSEFWDEACAAFLGMAILAWYNVFGSHKSNVHCSKTIRYMPKETEETEENFKKRISKSSIGLNGKQYEEYQKSIKDVRDKYIAHRDINWMDNIPTAINFETALNIAKEYEGWIRDLHKEECPDNHALSFDQIIETAEREIEDIATALKKRKR